MRVRQVVLLITVVFTASVAAQDNTNAGDTSLEGSAWGSGSGSDWTDSGSGSWGSHAMGSGSGPWASHSGSWASHSDSGSNDFTIDAGHSGSKSKSIDTDDDTNAGVDKESGTSAPPTVAPSQNSAATRITPAATTIACLLAALVSAYFA